MADDGQRLSRSDRDGDVAQHRAAIFPVVETDVAKFDVAAHVAFFDRTGVDLVGLVHDHEETVGARDTALQRGIDIGNAAHRLQHQHHCAEERNELAGRQVALE